MGASAWTPILRAGLGDSGTEVGHSSQDEGLPVKQCINTSLSIGPTEDYVLAEADWVSGNQGTSWAFLFPILFSLTLEMDKMVCSSVLGINIGVYMQNFSIGSYLVAI